jgi:hypothetical protein
LRAYIPNFGERDKAFVARAKSLLDRENQYFQSTYLFKYITIMNRVKFIPRKDEDFLRCFLRKLKHTVNKVLPLRDLAWSGGDRLRTLKRAVNKVSPLRGFTGDRQVVCISKPRKGDQETVYSLWGFTGDRQSRQGKPRRGNTLLTGCFSFRLRQASCITKSRRDDTLLTARFNVRKKQL